MNGFLRLKFPRRAKKISKLLILFIVLSTVVFVMRPYAEPKKLLIDDRILNIEKNLEIIDVYFYLDGQDSCGFRFTDADGGEFFVAIMSPKSSPKVYYGSLIDFDENNHIANPGENINYIVRIILSHPDMDERKSRALTKISGRYRDYIRFFAINYI